MIGAYRCTQGYAALLDLPQKNSMHLHCQAALSCMVQVASNQGAVGVRYSYIICSAAENEFRHVETVPFLQWSLHRYGRSYGDRRDTYRRPDEGEGYNVQRADKDMVQLGMPNSTPLRMVTCEAHVGMSDPGTHSSMSPLVALYLPKIFACHRHSRLSRQGHKS